MKKQIKFQHIALANYDTQGNPIEGNEEGVHYFGGKFEVCGMCHGHGTHVRRDLDDSRLVDLMQEDGDYEGLEHYYRGDYDQVCSECDGERVQFVPALPEWAEKELNNYYEWERQDKAYANAERRACGGY